MRGILPFPVFIDERLFEVFPTAISSTPSAATSWLVRANIEHDPY
jgi:hypothetical protein